MGGENQLIWLISREAFEKGISLKTKLFCNYVLKLTSLYYNITPHKFRINDSFLLSYHIEVLPSIVILTHS